LNDGSPLVPLRRVIRCRKEFLRISESESYKRCRVQLHAKGVVLRDIVSGSDIKTKEQQFCRTGEFLVAEIDAKVGGFGIVPAELDGAIVSSHYFLFEADTSALDGRFLDFFIRTPAFRDQVSAQGSTNYAAIRPSEVLGYRMPLPPLDEQRRIVARIEELAARIEEARRLQSEVAANMRELLLGIYNEIVRDAPRITVDEVAPLRRRPINVDFSEKYYELGIRSFGRGTFHKLPVSGAALGTKRIFSIEPGDLLFNIVFAWEGAVAVAKPNDSGRVGSHRFLTCVPQHGLATSSFLCFHFLTDHGLQQLGEASPGGAGRNRTLGLEALKKIQVPVPAFKRQIWFDSIQAGLDYVKRLQAESTAELDALMLAILDKAFKGKL